MAKRTKEKKRRTFTPKEKAEALRLLTLNSYNYSQTAREIGITRQALFKWHKDGGADVLKEKNLSLGEAMDAVDKELMEKYPNIADLRLKAIEKTIKRAMAVLPYSSNLMAIASILKALDGSAIQNPGDDQQKVKNIFSDLKAKLATKNQKTQ